MATPTTPAPRRKIKVYVVTFASIVANGQQAFNIAIAKGTRFEIADIRMSCKLANTATFPTTVDVAGVANAAVAAHAKLPRTGETTIAKGTMPTMADVFVQFAINGANWQDNPVPADLFTSEPGFIAPLPADITLLGNTNLTVTVSFTPGTITAATLTGAAIAGSLVLVGTEIDM